MAAELAAAKSDDVRRVALAAAADASWLAAVRTFHAKHRAAFASADGSSRLEWAELHERYQVECESKLEGVMASAKAEPEAVMTALMASVPALAATIAPVGLTPLPSNAWLPLRAFVEYQAFEQLMQAELKL